MSPRKFANKAARAIPWRLKCGRSRPPLDELEDGHPCFGMGAEPPAVEQLAFESGEEALAHGIVVAIPDRSGGRAHAGVPALLAEGERGVLRSLSEWWITPSGRRCQRAMSRAWSTRCVPQVVGHGPAHHAASEGFQHDGEEQETGPSNARRSICTSSPTASRSGVWSAIGFALQHRGTSLGAGTGEFRLRHSTVRRLQM